MHCIWIPCVIYALLKDKNAWIIVAWWGSVYLFIDLKIVLHPRFAKQMVFHKDSTDLTNEMVECNYCELLHTQALFQNS